jgi:hypothetical protein
MYDREFGLNLREYETYASHEAGDKKLIHDKIELIRETATDTPHVDTLQDTIADSYENAASYHASATLTSLIGTHMHVESEIEDAESYTLRDVTPITPAEIETLYERGFDLVAFALGDSEHDWLAD